MRVAHIITSRVLILASVAMSWVLSSCAVLTVDVDVYKGPLMNQESIQMEQLIPLAEGAMPLLTHLRDDLEWQDDGHVPESATGWYKPGYVKMSDQQLPLKKCHNWVSKIFVECSSNEIKGFTNPLARRVNNLLVWYEPVDESSMKLSETANGQIRGGLTEKIAQYRSSKPNNKTQLTSQADIQSSRDVLIESLVPFAAKLLFLANHEGLSASPETDGLVSGGVGNLSRGILGDTVTEAFSPMVSFDNIRGKGTLAGRKRTQYVRLLQAVGNSILLLANELREQAEARKDAPVRRDAEKAALEATFGGDPFRAYVNLIRELGEEKKGQAILAASLQSLLEKIDQDMNSLEGKASEKTASSEWRTKEYIEEQRYIKLHDQLDGVLQLLERDKVTPLLSKGTQSPQDAADAWAKLLEEVRSALKDEKLSTNAKEHLDSVKGNIKFEDAAKISYFKVWEIVKTYLEGERKTLSDIETERKKFKHLIALFEEKEARATQKKLVEEKASALKVAETVVKAEKSAVLARLENQDVFVSSRGVYLTLAIHLRNKLETDGTNAAIRTALDELNQHIPPPDFAISQMSKLPDAKAVLDHEIALLRQEHIQAVRTGGEDADAVKRALDTLEAAAQHRASMVHLRPAAAYLRTSYPSTSLQDDPNLTWDNLLLQQGLRNIPFSSYMADLLNPEAGHDRSISADLDKQYWQNINRVRVSGAGKTNYVLAKDDVGNWYVKQYFGDTARIFESARKLGMYNLAPTLGTGLLASLKDKHPKDGGSTEDPQSTPLKRVFDKHQSAYSSKTTADVNTLKELAEKDVLAMKIKERWDSLPDLKGEDETLKKFKDGLTSPLKNLKDRIAEIDKDNKTRDGVRVIQEIQAIRDFHQALNASIESIDLPSPSSGSLSEDKQKADAAKQEREDTCLKGFPDPCKEATTRETYAKQNFESGKSKHDRTVKYHTAKVVADVVQEKLSSLVQGRQRLLQDYEQTILFVGDASKN